MRSPSLIDVFSCLSQRSASSISGVAVGVVTAILSLGLATGVLPTVGLAVAILPLGRAGDGSVLFDKRTRMNTAAPTTTNARAIIEMAIASKALLVCFWPDDICCLSE